MKPAPKRAVAWRLRVYIFSPFDKGSDWDERLEKVFGEYIVDVPKRDDGRRLVFDLNVESKARGEELRNRLADARITATVVGPWKP